jgi:hypothetical protein
MTENDLLRASPSKLQELAKFYGLRLQGKRNLWVCRKSASHPLTKKQHFFKWSTQTADLRTALLRAIPKVEDFLSQIQTHLAAPVRSTNNQFSMGELKTCYLDAPTVQATPASRKRNWGDLERIVRIVHGAESDPASMSVGVINRELAKEYQRRRLAQIEVGAKGDMLAIEAGKRAMNSTLAHAQSVFSRQALEDFHALRLPPTTTMTTGTTTTTPESHIDCDHEHARLARAFRVSGVFRLRVVHTRSTRATLRPGARFETFPSSRQGTNN